MKVARFLTFKGPTGIGSGMWDGQIFSQVPEMRLYYMYKYEVSFNENESYCTYSLHNSSIRSRVVLDVLGWLDN